MGVHRLRAGVRRVVDLWWPSCRPRGPSPNLSDRACSVYCCLRRLCIGVVSRRTRCGSCPPRRRGGIAVTGSLGTTDDVHRAWRIAATRRRLVDSSRCHWRRERLGVRRTDQRICRVALGLCGQCADRGRGLGDCAPSTARRSPDKECIAARSWRRVDCHSRPRAPGLRPHQRRGARSRSGSDLASAAVGGDSLCDLRTP